MDKEKLINKCIKNNKYKYLVYDNIKYTEIEIKNNKEIDLNLDFNYKYNDDNIIIVCRIGNKYECNNIFNKIMFNKEFILKYDFIRFTFKKDFLEIEIYRNGKRYNDLIYNYNDKVLINFIDNNSNII